MGALVRVNQEGEWGLDLEEDLGGEKIQIRASFAGRELLDS